MSKSATDRLVPTGGSLEKVGLLKFEDIIDGFSGANELRGEQIALYGHPARFRKIASQFNGSNNTEFPEDGSGTAQAGTSNTITLAAGASAIDLTGMLVLTVSGTGANQVRRISSYNTSSKQATVDRNWSVNPANGTGYRILIDCFRLSELHVKSEFENGASTDKQAVLCSVLYDYPDTSSDAFARSPMRFPDYLNVVENLDLVTGTEETGYRLGRTRTVPVRGALGAKIILVTKPATGKISLWACGT